MATSLLGPDVDPQVMIDHWCRNPASKRFLREQAEREYDRICRFLAQNVVDFINDLPVLSASAELTSGRAKEAFKKWPYEKKLIVSGRKDSLSAAKIDKAVHAYQRKTGRPKKYHGRNSNVIAAIHSRVEKEARDKGFYEFIQEALCDPYR